MNLFASYFFFKSIRITVSIIQLCYGLRSFFDTFSESDSKATMQCDTISYKPYGCCLKGLSDIADSLAQTSVYVSERGTLSPIRDSTFMNSQRLSNHNRKLHCPSRSNTLYLLVLRHIYYEPTIDIYNNTSINLMSCLIRLYEPGYYKSSSINLCLDQSYEPCCYY